MVRKKDDVDLGLKIGSEDEVFWTNVRDKAKAGIITNKNEIRINKIILAGAENKIKQEENK